MSDRRGPEVSSWHRRFEELAVGYALDALDSEDEAVFTAHLSGCSRCESDVRELRRTASLLAESASIAEPPPGLRGKILAAATSGKDRVHPEALGAPAAQPSEFGELRILRIPLAKATRRRVLVGAAALALVVGGILGGLFATGGGLGEPPASCSAASGCTTVTLTSALTHLPAAQVIVSGTSVWVRPVRLAPDDSARQIYVLWALHASGSPRAVGGFDVSRAARGAVPVGSLSAPPSRGTSFAISLERGRRLPSAPTDIVAVHSL